MHVLIADAGLSPGFTPPALPHLTQLLSQWALVDQHGGDPTDPHPPAERVLAALRGHAPHDALPTAAWLLQAAGIDPGTQPWALLTPVHVQLDAKQALLLRPAQLQLCADESAALWTAVAPLFPGDEGWHTRTISPTQWLVSHASLAGWQAASLARVELRTLDAWLPQSRPLRRLQNEIQMTLFEPPLNAEREAQGLLTVNSVWISGVGVARGQTSTVVVNDSLREPLLTSNVQAWQSAWQQLDQTLIEPLLASGGRLTLAGETWAHTYAPQAQAWWRKLLSRPQPGRVNQVLEAL